MGLDIDTLLATVELLARKETDGHLTILYFTEGVKVMLGTPNLDINGRKEVKNLMSYSSLEDALMALLIENRK